jgi:hypothetical protein
MELLENGWVLVLDPDTLRVNRPFLFQRSRDAKASVNLSNPVIILPASVASNSARRIAALLHSDGLFSSTSSSLSAVEDAGCLLSLIMLAMIENQPLGKSAYDGG